MDGLFAVLLGASSLLSLSLGFPYMKAMEKLGWPDEVIAFGMIALVSSIILFAMALYLSIEVLGC